MSNKPITEVKKTIEDIEAKIGQASRIRLKLKERTSKSISIYREWWLEGKGSKRRGMEQISIIQNILRRRGRFLSIVEKGISNAVSLSEESVDKLSNPHVQSKNAVDAKTLKRELKILTSKLEKTKKKFGKIRRMMKKQEEFLSAGKKYDFERFVRSFESEFKIDKKILKILNPAKIQPIMYTLERTLQPTENPFLDLKSMIVAGAGTGASVNIAQMGKLDPSILVSILAGMVGGALVRIAFELYEYERAAYAIQSKAIKG